MLKRTNLIGLLHRLCGEPKRKPKSRTLGIEVLEDRTLLAVFASLADAGGRKVSLLKDGQILQLEALGWSFDEFLLVSGAYQGTGEEKKGGGKGGLFK